MSVRRSAPAPRRMRPARNAALLSACLLMTACAGDPEAAPRRTVWVPVGPPVSCITTHQIRSTRVVDDRTIDFEASNNRTFRNNLPFRCSGLTFNQAIRHNSRTSQLCRVDTITVIAPGRGPRGPTCQLGSFQPMKRAPVPEAPPAG